MKGACFNCHDHTFVDNFYQQFDDLVFSTTTNLPNPPSS